MVYCILGCFTYPTYYDNETGMCVETCPARFYGAVSGTSNNLTTDRARNCLPSKIATQMLQIYTTKIVILALKVINFV